MKVKEFNIDYLKNKTISVVGSAAYLKNMNLAD